MGRPLLLVHLLVHLQQQRHLLGLAGLLLCGQ
jgi:hypothetical protein